MSKQSGQASWQRTDVASAATTVLTSVATRRVRITGTTNISAITMNAWQILEAEFSGASLTITHNATTLNLPNNGQNLTVRAGDTCLLSADGAGNVTMWSYTPRTVIDTLWLAAGGVIDVNAGDVTFTFASNAATFTGGTFICTMGSTITALRSINTTDSSQVEVLRLDGDRATPANNDEATFALYMSDTAGTQAEVARVGWQITDASPGSIDGRLIFWAKTANAMAREVAIDGAATYPVTDGGQTLGIAASNRWDGVNLTSGAAINWNNGDVTITHSANALAFAGGSSGYSFDAAVTAGSVSAGSPVTKTADFTVAATENMLICNKASTTTVTLPAAATFPGRILVFKTIQAQTVVSASSNVVPNTTATAGTAILPATDGAWAMLVSDGTNWITMASSTIA